MVGQTIVVVIGMHRSGTSLTMQALGQLGLASSDDLVSANAFNPHGHFEATEVVALHDRLLADLDRPWGSFKHLLPLPEGWQSSVAADVARTGISNILETMLQDAKPQAIKDPRMSLFMPLWLEVAARRGVNLRTIICLRNSWDVAQSLLRRDRIPVPAGRLLWLLYTATAIRDAQPDSTLLSYFDDWTAAPDAALARLAEFVGRNTAAAATVYEAELATQTKPVGDAVLLRWHAALEAARSTGRINAKLQADAAAHLEYAAHFKILADILSDVGLQQEMSTTLVQKLDQLQQDRDALAARAHELLGAYQTESARAEALQTGLLETAAERDAQGARAVELLAAYQTESARAEVLQKKLARLNPRNWLRRT